MDVLLLALVGQQCSKCVWLARCSLEIGGSLQAKLGVPKGCKWLLAVVFSPLLKESNKMYLLSVWNLFIDLDGGILHPKHCTYFVKMCIFKHISPQVLTPLFLQLPFLIVMEV